MADRVLVVAWDRPYHGSEERAIEAFNESVGILGRKQNEGRIEGFEIVMMAPNSEMGGFFLVKGSPEQIHNLREDDEFQRSTVHAQMAVDGIRHLEGVTGEAVARQVELFREASQAIPQHA